MLEFLNTFYSNLENNNQPVIAGIDEAGRGPAIGPMVYGLYVATLDEKTSFKDSKVLCKEAREKMFTSMKRYAYYMIDPCYITSYMESGVKNLNEIAKEAVVKLLAELTSKCKNVKCVYIDGLGNNEAYKKYLEQFFNLTFIIENKADSKYQSVSGASIVAKVTRDEAVDKLNLGSGYPSDPITQTWLNRNAKTLLNYNRNVRHSWATIKSLLPQKKARRLEKSLSNFYTDSN